MKRCGVYIITCIPSGKRYVGSSVDIDARWSIHKTSLRHGKHVNVHLQRAWAKYGEAAFSFELVELVDGDPMAAEQRWLDDLRPELNINPNADAPMRGRKATPEHRAKISASGRGRVVSEETRRKISEANRGNKCALGCKRSPEFKERLRAQMTPELKKKLRAGAEARRRVTF